MSDSRHQVVVVNGLRVVGDVDPDTNEITVTIPPTSDVFARRKSARQERRLHAMKLAEEALALNKEIMEQASGLKRLAISIGRGR